MSQQNLIKPVYQPPAGLNYRESDSVKGMGLASSMKNVDHQQSLGGDSIGQRPGFQVIADLMGSIYSDLNGSGWLWDGTHETPTSVVLHNKVLSTGEEDADLIVLGRGLSKAVEKDLVITYSGAAANTWVKFIAAGGVRRCEVTENGVSVLSASCGTGEGFAGYVSTRSIADQIDALANFSCTVDGDTEGVVSGNQVAVTSILLQAGHTFAIGDYAYFTNQAGTPAPTCRQVTRVSGNRIYFGGGAVSVNDTDSVVSRVYRHPAAFIPQTLSDLSGGGAVTLKLTVFESYYSAKPQGDLFLEHFNDRDEEEWRAFSSVSINNVLYFNAPMVSIDSLFKCDGQNYYRAGLPKPVDLTVVAGAGAGVVDVGDHSWRFTYICKDAQGNITESEIGDSESLTIAAPNQTVTLTLDHTGMGNIWGNNGYLSNYAYCSLNMPGASSTVPVYDTTPGDHSLHVGDVVYLYDRNSGSYEERTVVAAEYPGTGGTIYLDSPVQLNLDDPISVNMRLGIYRTLAGGSDYYLVDEVPMDFGGIWNENTTYVDGKADSNLGAKYIWPDPNENHGPPPVNPRALVEYQGSLVLVGSTSEPLTIHPSVPGNPEYYASSLATDVGQDDGEILTAADVASDVLVLFKSSTCYALTGQILDPTTVLPGFRVDLLSASVGCPSAHGTARSKADIYFISEQGVYVTRSGGTPEEVADDLSDISAYFIDLDKETDPDYIVHLNKAQCAYDRIKKKVICYLPTTKDAENRPNANGKMFVWDIKKGGWKEWTNITPMGNMVYTNNSFYWTWFDPVTGLNALAKRLEHGDQYDACDHVDPIDWEFVTGWESLGDDEQAKHFKRLAVSAPQSGTVFPFTLTVESQKNYATNARTQVSKDFTSSDRILRSRLLAEKSKTLRLKFSNNVLYEEVLISSWNLEIVGVQGPGLRRQEDG